VQPNCKTPTKQKQAASLGDRPEEQGTDSVPICDSDAAPCIREGEYLAFCHRAQRYRNPRFKREEIALGFRLCECEWQGTNLFRYFSAKTAGSKRSDYRRECVIANQGLAPSRGDRLPYTKFKGKLFRVRVVTVRTDAYQEKLPCALQYSKVGCILELVQTNEKITDNYSAQISSTGELTNARAGSW
jgi:hypothetical protein